MPENAKPKSLSERMPDLEPEALPDGTIIYVKTAAVLGPLTSVKATKKWVRVHQLLKEEMDSLDTETPISDDEVDHTDEIERLINEILLMVIVGPSDSLLALEDDYKWLLVQSAIVVQSPSAEGEVGTAPKTAPKGSRSRKPSPKSQGSTGATG